MLCNKNKRLDALQQNRLQPGLLKPVSLTQCAAIGSSIIGLARISVSAYLGARQEQLRGELLSTYCENPVIVTSHCHGTSNPYFSENSHLMNHYSQTFLFFNVFFLGEICSKNGFLIDLWFIWEKLEILFIFKLFDVIFYKGIPLVWLRLPHLLHLRPTFRLVSMSSRLERPLSSCSKDMITYEWLGPELKDWYGE